VTLVAHSPDDLQELQTLIQLHALTEQILDDQRKGIRDIKKILKLRSLAKHVSP
jgi:hypothetical protein